MQCVCALSKVFRQACLPILHGISICDSHLAPRAELTSGGFRSAVTHLNKHAHTATIIGTQNCMKTCGGTYINLRLGVHTRMQTQAHHHVFKQRNTHPHLNICNQLQELELSGMPQPGHTMCMQQNETLGLVWQTK